MVNKLITDRAHHTTHLDRARFQAPPFQPLEDNASKEVQKNDKKKAVHEFLPKIWILTTINSTYEVKQVSRSRASHSRDSAAR